MWPKVKREGNEDRVVHKYLISNMQKPTNRKNIKNLFVTLKEKLLKIFCNASFTDEFRAINTHT